ncbi:hypothetical protein [Robiginitalea sp.]|uniref:hypothetical protein n=1 Tax=Robiginitalea sp. TaxID=1902411 RepID=UPI003C7616D0
MNNTVLLLLTLVIFTSQSRGQETLSGSIEGWTQGEGEVYTGVFSLTEVGSIDALGNFEIPLKPGYLSEVKEKMAAENSDPERKFSSELMTLGESCQCAEGNIELVNGDQELTTLAILGFMLANMEKKEKFGLLIPASSKDFAEGYSKLGAYEHQTGYAVDWYYVDKPGVAKGDCSMESYPVNGDQMYTRNTSYNLDLKPGWNLIKYEISEIFTDEGGKRYPVQESYTSILELPSDMQFVFLPE